MDLSPMQNKSRSEQVAQRILSMIEEGLLHEGDKLPSEPEFAKQLGISRGILREGLAQLKAHGIIRRKPKDGTYIMPLAGTKGEMAESARRAIQASSFRNIMEMRSAIEQKAAALAVDRATDEELEQLRKTVLEPQTRSGEDDLDFFFHYRLVELSGNSIFMDIVNTYFKEIRQIRDSNLKDASYVQEVQNEHLAIVEALCRRDKETAEAAVEQHMERIWDRWRRRNLDGVEEREVCI